MLKFKVFTLILLASVLISHPAYCQQTIQNRQIQSIAGTVVSIDAGSGVLVVQTDSGNVELYISVESNLFRDTEPMSSIEISKGDHITVQYDNSSGKNIVTTLTDRKPDAASAGYTFNVQLIKNDEA